MGGGTAAGTLDMASSRTVSTLMPSATAMRCRSTYGAISRTSSIVAVSPAVQAGVRLHRHHEVDHRA